MGNAAGDSWGPSLTLGLQASVGVKAARGGVGGLCSSSSRQSQT